MRSRLAGDAVAVEDAAGRVREVRLADVIGRPVTDPAGAYLGTVVGRILSGSGVDLLVRRRRLLHRSLYMRLAGAATTVTDGIVVHHPPAASGSVRLEVVRATEPGDHLAGDAA